MTMSLPRGREPVRRSPLATEHERLGAHWISDHARWPANFGSMELERATVRTAAGLADVGPLVKLSVSAPDIAAELARIGLGGEVGSIISGTLAGFSVDVWFLAPDEALVTYQSPAPADPAAPDASAPAIRALRSAGFAPVEQSSGIAVLVLAGPAGPPVLGDCFPIDVHSSVLADRHLASGPVAGIRTVVGRVDRDGLPSFTLLVARDLTVSLWTALLEIGAIHGLQPVGMDALSGSSW